jgi:hypothetical protein
VLVLSFFQVVFGLGLQALGFIIVGPVPLPLPLPLPVAWPALPEAMAKAGVWLLTIAGAITIGMGTSPMNERSGVWRKVAHSHLAVCRAMIRSDQIFNTKGSRSHIPYSCVVAVAR